MFAISTGFQLTKYIVVPEGLGFDARLYVLATKAWLAGGDPWATSLLGINFAAPPPTLLAMLPFTFVPEALLVPLAIVGSFALAVVAIRALGLPLWWLAFWPIVDSALVGNPNIAVLAVLIVASRRLDIFAPFLKLYAMAPLVADRRWRSLVIAVLVMVATAPLLAWDRWFMSLAEVSGALERTAQTTSVYGNGPLMVVGVVALLALGIRRAGWLAVPVLWPWTQPHYMAMSAPALSPMLAIVWSLPGIPPIVTLGSVVLAAIGLHMRPLRGETPTQATLHLGASA